MGQTSWPWAIILCKFSDLPSIPESPPFYQDLYTRNGTGGVCDYWREVTFGSLDLTQSQVFGWFTMNHSSSELSSMHFPGDRWKLVQWGIDTAQANSVNLSPFKSILVVQNWGVDHGFAGNGVVIVHSYQYPTWVDLGFICHEMGHGFGFPHSWSANPDTEYGDGWDIMSWNTATSSTSDYQTTFEGTSGKSGPGLNARNVEALGAVPPGGIWTLSQPNFNATITLHALNQPYGGSGYVVAEIPPNATTPPRASNSRFTVEFRHKGGPDQGIPSDVVLIHEIRTNGLSYLQPSWGSQFVTGQQFVTPDPKVYVQVMSIDPSSATATVQIHGDNGAAFVSQSVPTRMSDDRTVQVTMRNTGNTTWTAGGNNPYRLGSQNPQDNTTWGLARVDVPTSVPPGGQITFSFTISNFQLGTHNFQWRMVQEGIAWFGDYTPNVPILVVKGP